MNDQEFNLALRRVTSWIARRVHATYPTVSHDEAESAAMVGIAEAVQSYRPNRGATLATWLSTGGYLRTIDELRRTRYIGRSHGRVPGPARVARMMVLESDYATPSLDGATPDVLNRMPEPSPSSPPPHLGFSSIFHLTRKLRPSRRQMMELHYVHGWSFARIAKAQGVSPSAISLRFKATLKDLRRQLGAGAGAGASHGA